MALCRFLLVILAAAGTAPAWGQAVSLNPWASPLFLGAHRGGMGLWPENTVVAFTEAAKRWPHILLEGDLHLTSDGHVVVIHDGKVDRTTDGAGAVGEMTLSEIQTLDAGYTFTPDGGETFPFRGQGVKIPTLAEVLDAVPNHRFEWEFKDNPDLVPAAVAVFREKQAVERVIIASFKPELMKALRELAPEIATCFDTVSGMTLLSALRGERWDAYEPRAKMLSLPMRMLEQAKLTQEEVTRIQAKGIIVQLHTLNSPEEMAAARELGVQSILTNYPDRMDE